MTRLHHERLPREQRKALILHRARRVFAAKGYATTRVADIVAATDVSQGLIYTHFESKEALYADLMSLCFERVNGALEYLDGMPLTARDKIVLALTRILSGFGSDATSRESIRLVAQSSFSEGIPESARARIVAGQRAACGVLARILERGRDEGSVRALPAAELAELLWATMKGLALEEAIAGAGFRPPSVETIASLFFRNAAA